MSPPKMVRPGSPHPSRPCAWKWSHMSQKPRGGGSKTFPGVSSQGSKFRVQDGRIKIAKGASDLPSTWARWSLVSHSCPGVAPSPQSCLLPGETESQRTTEALLKGSPPRGSPWPILVLKLNGREEVLANRCQAVGRSRWSDESVWVGSFSGTRDGLQVQEESPGITNHNNIDCITHKESSLVGGG